MIQTEQIGEVRKFRLARDFRGRGLYFTGAYWVDGLMVDTGCSYTVGELAAALNGSTVERIVNTHSHEDHVAGNAVLQTTFGAEVLAHAGALAQLANPRKTRLRPYQLVMWGYPDPCSGRALGDSVETRHHTFQVIQTPGHSPDHVSLFEPTLGWLFTGDAYVGGRDRALRLDYNIWQIIESLKKLAALRPQVLFTGSGTVRHEPGEELAEKIEYLEETGGKIVDLHRKGWSRRRIRKEILGKELPIAYYTLGHFSGKNLVRSYIEDQP
jgi:glyoxylase-like metal-dependent hydrolase (beta-lactamase superfamily II)